MAEDPAPGGRTARKRAAIIAAARAELLAQGFRATTMDQVAARAQVSKQTVYKQFADKAGLFAAAFEDAIAEAEAAGEGRLADLGAAEDPGALEEALVRFARDHLATVLQPHIVQMRRMVIAEAGRFPDLARRWHDAAPARGHALLAEEIARLHGRGLLRAPDPALAAEHLNYLVLAAPLERAMLTGSAPGVRAQRRWADEAVRVFLAAYGASVP